MIAVAERWAAACRSTKSTGTQAEDEKLFGLKTSRVNKEDTEDVEIFDEDIESVDLFFRLMTQWKYHAMGGIAGLDYQSVKTLMDVYEITDKKKVMNDIILMECTVLSALRG